MLHVSSLSFSYNETPILNDLNFTVGRGENVAIMGGSGCGKSTLLKLIYGILQPKEGTLYWGENQILGPDYNLVPGEKYMKYLSQDYDLMPFTTVKENVSEFLSVFEPEHLEARTAELLETIEMTEFSETKVRYLSGGQQQRVALARVLAQEPELLLLDEPFGHIDNFKKISLRRNIFNYLKEKNISCIVASHDSGDVLAFADSLIVLKDATVLASGAPKDMYQNPPSPYISKLFGQANYIPIKALKPYASMDDAIVIYPQELKVAQKNGLSLVVQRNYYQGTSYLIEGVTADEEKIYFEHPTPLEENTKVFVNVAIEIINQRLGIIPPK